VVRCVDSLGQHDVRHLCAPGATQRAKCHPDEAPWWGRRPVRLSRREGVQGALNGIKSLEREFEEFGYLNGGSDALQLAVWLSGTAVEIMPGRYPENVHCMR
jgi:hypothetical protein